MQIVMKKLSEITPYAHNPRNNAGAVDAVARSIREFGFRNPILLDRDGVIIAGHTRVLAAKSLGMDEVPCVMADDLTPEQVKAFRIADNKTAEIADWDYELLPIELRELQDDGFDLSLLGFDTTELEQLLADKEDTVTEGQTEADAVPDAPGDFTLSPSQEQLMNEISLRRNVRIISLDIRDGRPANVSFEEPITAF